MCFHHIQARFLHHWGPQHSFSYSLLLVLYQVTYMHCTYCQQYLQASASNHIVPTSNSLPGQDFSLTIQGLLVNFLTDVKFVDISMFSRQGVILHKYYEVAM